MPDGEIFKDIKWDFEIVSERLRELAYLNKELDYSKMRERIIVATRQFAKRQLTWLRNTSGTVWFDAADRDISRTVGSYLRARLADQN